MQGWSRPLCHMLGPNDTLYASIIWNCFFIYAIFRVALDWYQRRIRKSQQSIIQIESSPRSRSLNNNGILLYYEQLITNLSNNRHSKMMSIIVSFAYFVFFFIFFYINSFSGTKAPIAYVVDFFAGVAAASVFETIFNALYQRTNSYNEVNTERSRSTSLIPNQNRIVMKYIKGLSSLLLQFTPDICVVLILLIFSTAGGHRSEDLELLLKNVFIQYVTIFLILSLLFQTKDTRICITRVFIENTFIRTIGYGSYPIYLLQQVVFNFYLRIFYDLAIGAPVTSDPAYGIYWENEWFGLLPGWWKPIGLVLITIVGYIVQKYFQDTFIAWLISKYTVNNSNNNNKMTSSNFKTPLERPFIDNANTASRDSDSMMTTKDPHHPHTHTHPPKDWL
eukprot:gene5613-11330_t